MAGISQVIPNYIQGVSNQPDELKVPGQVRDLVNAWPDVTRGCMKRLGSKHIADLNTTPDGEWFSIDRGRDPSQQYLGHLTWLDDPDKEVIGEPHLEIWDMEGRPQRVWYTDVPWDDPDIPKKNKVKRQVPKGMDYLIPKKNIGWKEASLRQPYQKYNHLQVIQGDGKTFLLNDAIEPRITQEKKAENEKYFESYLSLRQVQYQREYLLAFDDPSQFDKDDNIKWTYATNFSDVKWNSGDPNDQMFEENQVTQACDLSFGFTKHVVNGDDLGGGGKIVTISTSNTKGRDLEMSLEVLCRPIQEIDRHIKNPAKDDYRWLTEYTIRAELLKGGKYWEPGDKIIIGYKPDKSNVTSYWDDYLNSDGLVQIELTIGAAEEASIMADIGYISVKTDKGDTLGDASIPFASANDIIQGLCYGLEQAGAIPLKYDDKGEEVPATKELYSEPGTVTVSFGGSGTENVTEDVNGPENDKGKFLASLNIEFKPIGNGIYMRKKPGKDDKEAPFKLVTPEDQLFNHMSTKERGEWYCVIHAVSRLPNQCRHNLHVLVRNSENNDDDYYLKFVGHDNSDGEGSWEETVRPGDKVRPTFSTMPHELIRLDDGSWLITPIQWQAREVGDENTAKAPSFLQEFAKDYKDDDRVKRVITGMAWHRNRFVLLSGKCICMSADGDYYNFWPKTAMTVNEIDPIDIEAAVQMPAPLKDAMEVNAGLVLFAKDEQFLLTTDAEGFRPGSAKVMSLAKFNYNVDVHPIKIGSNIGFMSDAGLNDKLFEMSKVSREGSEPEVIELSKIIQPRLPDNMDLLTNTKSNMCVFLSKYWTPRYLFSDYQTGGKDKNKFRLFNQEEFRQTWLYKYYSDGQKRVQASWSRWVFDFPLCYHTCIDDNYYVVLWDDNDCTLRKVGLKHETSIRPVYLDGYYNDCPVGCVTTDRKYTILNITQGLWREDECVYIEKYHEKELFKTYKCNDEYEPDMIGWGKVKRYPPDDPHYPCKWYVVLEGDWLKDVDCTDPNNPWRILVGKPYSLIVDLPTTYVTKKEGESSRSKWDPHLTLHRYKFSVGKEGTYKVRVRRKGRETIDQWYDVNFDYPFLTEESFTQPIYMRNIDIEVRFYCDDPQGGILHSMQWEGDYNPKWYKYV